MSAKNTYGNYEESPDLTVIYRSKAPLLVSLLGDGAFQKSWKTWKNRVVELREDATLVYRKSETSPIKAILSINPILIYRILVDSKEIGTGVNIFCNRDGFETELRIIFPEAELDEFYNAIISVCKDHNFEEFASSMGWRIDKNFAKIQRKRVTIDPNATTTVQKLAALNTSTLRKQNSSMRKATRRLDANASQNLRQQIIDRRGVWKWLPILFHNDLIHGSWWFVLGSIYITVCSAIPLITIYYPIFDAKEEGLSMFSFSATWILMLLSGFFFTIGSIAFVRAVEEPHLRPIFHGSKHFASDELLGAWLFLLAMIPAIPYSAIFLAEYHGEMIYVGMLGVSCIFVLGTYMFVLACYPPENQIDGHPGQILNGKIVACVKCCFGDKEWVNKHCANDWLTATWIIFWGTLFATVISGMKFAADWYYGQSLGVFIWGTGFADMLWFLIGSMYFVAGSYSMQETSLTGLYHEKMKAKGKSLQLTQEEDGGPALEQSFVPSNDMMVDDIEGGGGGREGDSIETESRVMSGDPYDDDGSLYSKDEFDFSVAGRSIAGGGTSVVGSRAATNDDGSLYTTEEFDYSVAGKSVAGMSVAERSVAGRSVADGADKSTAGNSLYSSDKEYDYSVAGRTVKSAQTEGGSLYSGNEFDFSVAPGK